MRGFVLHGRIVSADILGFWLPQYCHLGRSLRAGNVPAWNPLLMGGAPFAADPQSGWMAVLPMALFAAMPCSAAITWLIALHPVVAGLGVYAFARSERASRAAAAVGGVGLALMIAGSNIDLSVPFAAMLAWTPVVLAGTSRYLRAGAWAGRLGWGLAAALAWGQLASAHLGMGALLGTLVVCAFVLARIWSLVASGERSAFGALVAVAALAFLAVAVNLAILLPRLAYLATTNLELGYAGLAEFESEILGLERGRPTRGRATDPTWPLNLASAPGPYLGAAVLVLALAAWWNRPRRSVVAAFSLTGAGLYVLALTAVAERVPPSLRSVRAVDLYLHNPYWLILVLPLLMTVLAVFGVEAWTESSPTRRAFMILPGLVVWGVLPLALGAPASAYVVALLGALAAGALLAAHSARPWTAALLPLVLALELLLAMAWSGPGQPFPAPRLVTRGIDPSLDASAYERLGPIVGALRGFGDRSARLEVLTGEGRSPETARGLIQNHALLFGVETVGAYNPVQPLRTWAFVRAAQDRRQKYSRSFFGRETRGEILDLLHVGSIIATERVPGVDAVPITKQGPWSLFRRPEVPGRATFVPRWVVVDDAWSALDLVAGAGFDSSRLAVLERDPGLPEATGVDPGVVSWRAHGHQELRLEVTATVPGIVIVRAVHDRLWRAEVDGRSVPLLRADFLLQGVAVTPGRHVVVLRYDDPWIGYGMAGSVLTLAFVGTAAIVLTRRSPSGDRGRSGR